MPNCLRRKVFSYKFSPDRFLFRTGSPNPRPNSSQSTVYFQGNSACAHLSTESGAVRRSSSDKMANASSLVSPHMSLDGCNCTHTSGLSGLPNSLHLLSSVNCTQRTPAGFPSGIPGIGDEIEITIQQAAQPERQSIHTAPFCFIFILSFYISDQNV